VLKLREEVGKLMTNTSTKSAVSRELRQMPPLNRLRHPLIESFETKYSARDDVGTLRETISSVTDRTWLKQKSSRWRGAAIEIPAADSQMDTIWLGAAGYRRDGSPDDFYAWFSSKCGTNSDSFLPTPGDLKLFAIDREIAKIDAWKVQIHVSTLVLLANVADGHGTGPMVFSHHTDLDTPLLELSISIATESVGDEAIQEVIISVRTLSRVYDKAVDVATVAILAAIAAESTTWRPAPAGDGVMTYATWVTTSMTETAEKARADGGIADDDLPTGIRTGTYAHYGKEDQLTSATVEGDPVEAMCGHWFVPMHDPETAKPCTACARLHAALPE
jgi:hypothetical protein